MDRLKSTAPVLVQECLELVEQTLRLEFCALVRTAPGNGGASLLGVSRHTSLTALDDGLREWVRFAASQPDPVHLFDLQRSAPFALPEVLRGQNARIAFSTWIEGRSGRCALLLGASSAPRLWGPDRVAFLHKMRAVISTALGLLGIDDEAGLGLARVAAVIEDSPALISVKGLEGRYLLVNRRFEQVFGVEARAVVGRTDAEVFGPTEGERHAANDEEVAGGEAPVEFDEDYLLSDGRHAFRTIKFQLRDDQRQPYALCSLSVDVTVQRQLEDELRQSEERYRLATRASEDTIWDLDLNTDRVEWNDGLTRVFGYAPTERRSGLDWWYQHVHPDERDAVLASLRDAIARRKHHWSAEYRFRAADGGYRHVLDRGWVVYDEHGRGTRMIGSMLDFSERTRAEAERSRLFAEAQEAVRVRDEFLAIASHELKTPLTTLHLYLQYLRGELQKQVTGEFSPTRLAWKIEAAERQVRRLSELVNNLLDISRMSAGQMELALETVDLAELVREQLARFRDQFEHAGTPLHASVPRSLVGRWDPLRIEQVLTNLLSNAVKYGNQKPVEVVLEGDEEQVRLTIRDHGIGIAPEDQARIFDRFERAVSVRHFGGFGLGLWIVKRILAAHGGAISVQSTPGQGSTFTVELPRVPARDVLEQTDSAPLVM